MLVNVRPHFKKVYPQNTWRVEYPRPYKKLLPDIVVSGEMLDRALEVANVLFLAMERRGHQVTLAPPDRYFRRPAPEHRDEPRGPLREFDRDGWYPGRPTVALIGTVAIGLTLHEITEYVEVERVNDHYVRKDTLPPRKHRESWRSDWVHKEDMPSGRLALRAYSPYPAAAWQRDWREKAPGDLPAQAEAIIRGLTKAAPIIADLVAEAHRKAEAERQAHEAQHREWLKAERTRKRAEAQKSSLAALLAAIQHWASVRQIEEFFAAVEDRLHKLPIDQRAAVVDRLARARAMIGDVDALRRLLDWKTPEELSPTDDDPIE